MQRSIKNLSFSCGGPNGARSWRRACSVLKGANRTVRTHLSGVYFGYCIVSMLQVWANALPANAAWLLMRPRNEQRSLRGWEHFCSVTDYNPLFPLLRIVVLRSGVLGRTDEVHSFTVSYLCTSNALHE